MLKLTEYFVDTHTQIAISGIPALMDIIHKNAPATRHQESDDHPLHVVEAQQINAMLNGPLSSFCKQKLTAYAKLLRLKLILTINNDDTFKTARRDNPLVEGISEKFLKKLDGDKLKPIHQKLDELTKAHYKELQDFFAEACQKLMAGLREAGIELTILEIAEFTEQVPVENILNRFKELNIPLPKLDNKDFTYTKFLKLRAELIIHNALSRQHQAHTEKEIKPYQKALNKTFSEIDKIEQTLLTQQTQQTKELLKPIEIPTTPKK